MLRNLDKWLKLTETELRVKILDSVEGLTLYRPDQWPASFLDSITAEQDPAAFVAALVRHSGSLEPAVESLNENDLLSALRYCALILDPKLKVEQARYYSIQAADPLIEKVFLVAIYALVVENGDSDWQFEFPPDQISEILRDWGSGGFTKGEQFGAELCAYAEIEKFVSTHPRGAEFGGAKEQFLLKASRYVNDSLSSVIHSLIIRLSVESCLKFLPEFRDFDTSLLDSADQGGQRGIKELIDEMNKVDKRSFANRFGLKERRGGPRNKSKTAWTDEMKIKLFEATDALPRISQKPMWEYAFNELMEKDFSSRIVQYLRYETPLKDAPHEIFSKAIKTWRKYEDAFEKPKGADSHQAFALYHANAIIGGPESKYSTLRKYFYDGQRLANASKNSGESKE